jgi:hypothetical protein
MITARRGVCAAGLTLLLLAGCKNVSNVAGFFALDNGTGGQDRVMTGSLEAVAESTQGTLRQLGFTATRTEKNDAIYLASKTASGASFTLVLTRIKGKNGESTKVHIEWNGPKDDSIGLSILGQVEASKH